MLDFLMLSAAGMVGLYALQQASRRSRHLLTSDDQQVAVDTPCALNCECFLFSPPRSRYLLVCACVIIIIFYLFIIICQW